MKNQKDTVCHPEVSTEGSSDRKARKNAACGPRFLALLGMTSGVIFTFALCTLHLSKAHAQTLSLSISPSILEVMIKPGKSITQVYKLTNTGEPIIVTPKLYELGSNGIKEDQNFVADKWISIISNDIDFEKPFLLQSNKTAEFLLKISPTATTQEQDYYRAVVFTTTPNLPADSTISSLAQNLASPLLVTITSTGILTKAAQITKFDLPKIIDSFDPLVTDVEVKNTGKTYFRPVGKLSLAGIVGRGSYDIIPGAILSGQNKQLVTEHTPPSTEPIQSLHLPGFYLGKYQLELQFSLDESTAKISQVKTFYAIPWKAGVIVFGLIVFSVMIKRKKKAD